MSNQFSYVCGIDISKAKFTFCLMNQLEVLHMEDDVPNNLKGFQSFIKSLKSFTSPENILFCMENTGNYSVPLAKYLTFEKLSVWVEDAKKIKRFIGPFKNKTDLIDSKWIAEFAYRNSDLFRPWVCPSKEVEEVQSLLSFRESLVKSKASITCQIKELQMIQSEDSQVILMMREWLKTIIEKIKDVEIQIKNIVESEQQSALKVSLIKSVKGFADLSAAYLYTYTKGFSFVPDPKAMAAHLGFAPVKFQSGSSVRKRDRSTGYGDLDLRRIFFTAAMNNTTNCQLGDYYQRLKAKGKPGWIPLNNLRVKLIRVICAILRDNRPFIPNHLSIEPRLAMMTK